MRNISQELKDLNDVLLQVGLNREQEIILPFEIVMDEVKTSAQNSERRMVKEEGKIDNFDPIGYIKNYLKKMKYTLHPSGYVFDDKNQTVNGFINEIEVQAYYDGVRSKDSKMLEKSYFYLVSQYKKEEVFKLQEKMKDYVPDTNNNMARYIKALTGVEPHEEEYPFILFCLEHFIRQVKLKICGLPVYQELMVIIVGGQNQGKSTAIRHLLSPLSLFYAERSLNDICNPEKNCQMFEDNYVLFCDEMQKAIKAFLEIIKSLMTAAEIYARKYHTQLQQKIKNNTTQIGTSNTPTSETICDITGMRRFIDIEIKIAKCDFNALKEIDYLALWKGVKHILSAEEKEEFFKTYNTLVAPKQEEMRAKDCVEEFVVDLTISKGEVMCATAKVYERYRQWCAQNGYNFPKTSKSFSKRLIRLLDIPSGKNYKDPSGNRALPLNKLIEVLRFH